MHGVYNSTSASVCAEPIVIYFFVIDIEQTVWSMLDFKSHGTCLECGQLGPGCTMHMTSETQDTDTLSLEIWNKTIIFQIE